LQALVTPRAMLAGS